MIRFECKPRRSERGAAIKDACTSTGWFGNATTLPLCTTQHSGVSGVHCRGEYPT
jgi:hypothetical protein